MDTPRFKDRRFYFSNAGVKGLDYFRCIFYSLKEAGFPVTLLPIVSVPGSRVGSLQFDWCGIPVGVPVLVGLGDLQCAVLSGSTSETDAGMYSMKILFPTPWAKSADDKMMIFFLFFQEKKKKKKERI